MRILVVGGGPGGYVAAIRAAQLGAQVMLAEARELGGTCLNRGCIPTKVLLHATGFLEELGKAKAWGISTENTFLDLQKTQQYKAKIVRQLGSGVAGLLNARGVEVYNGQCSLTGSHRVKINLGEDAVELAFDKAILATGSQPVRLPVPGGDLPGVITSDEALELESSPKSMVIIGGGVIGVELATVYARTGTKVTIVEAAEQILPALDEEVVAGLGRILRRLGVKVHTGCRVEKIQQAENGLEVSCDGAKGAAVFFGEKVLVSVGRKPLVENLGMEVPGIQVQKGAIVVDNHLRTTQPHIYAIGDCTGGMMLAHVASAQGVLAARNAVEGNIEQWDGSVVPSCVYTEPEVAAVGLTEAQARERHGDVEIGRVSLGGNGKTMLMGSTGLVKLVGEKGTGRLLGMHIFGPRATDLIAEGALALRIGATARQVASTIHPHPTVAEGIAEAAEDIFGMAIHKL